MSDRRERNFPANRFDPKANTVTLTIYDPEGDEVDTEFPAKFEVCGTCQGKGSHVNPSIDSQGISQEEFEQDPDFAESYFAGNYDMQCVECKGLRVVPVVNLEACSSSQQADLAIWEQQEQARADDDRADAYTRRMENGGYD